MAKKVSTRTETVAPAEVLRIPVHLIETDPNLDVRPTFGTENGHDKDALMALADNIDQVGQILPGAVLAFPKEGGGERFVIIDGDRRRKAIIMNAALGKTDTMDCKVFRGDSPQDALRKSLSANIHREDFTPMQVALNIEKVRATLSTPEKPAGSSQVGLYLNMAKPTVIKYEKLLKIRPESQKAVHEGTLSMSAAFELEENTIAEMKAQVAKLAKEKAAAEKAEQNRLKAEAAGKAPAEGTTPVETPAEGGEAAPAEAVASESGDVQARHVTAAARELNAQIQVRARSRKELVTFFTAMDVPAYGYQNSPARTFARAFYNWAAGDPKVTDRRVTNLFQELVEASGEGEPNATEKKDLIEKEAAEKARIAAKLEKAEKAKKKAATAEPATATA